MPVTAKLSKKFYDRLGDEVANEIVDWFNHVDTSYKSELRELNELNFARFSAQVDQRFAELRAELDRRFLEQNRWMVAMWAVLLVPIIGLWFR